MGPDLRLSAICSPGLLFNGNEDSVFFQKWQHRSSCVCSIFCVLFGNVVLYYVCLEGI